MKLHTDNLGKVAITIAKDYYDVNKDYDKLEIVQIKDKFATYISRKPVPAGIKITNRDYWIPFSSLKEDIVLDYDAFTKKYGKDLAAIREYMATMADVVEAGKNLADNIEQIKEDGKAAKELIDSAGQPEGVVITNKEGKIDRSYFTYETPFRIKGFAEHTYSDAEGPRLHLDVHLVDTGTKGYRSYQLPNASKTRTGVLFKDDFKKLENLYNKVVVNAGTAGNAVILNDAGYIPSENLPSYVDDIVEYNAFSEFPSQGQGGILYFDKGNNILYRWAETEYVALPDMKAINSLKNNVSQLGRKDTELENRLYALEQEAKFTMSIQPNIIYKNTPTTIHITGTFTAKDPSIVPEGITIEGKYENSTLGDVKTHTITEQASTRENQVEYTGTATVNGTIIHAKVNLIARYPIYAGFSENIVNTFNNLSNKLSVRTSANGIYKYTCTKANQYFFILVPADINPINNFTMNGAPFVMEYSTCNHAGSGVTYKVYKSAAIYNSGVTLNILAS